MRFRYTNHNKSKPDMSEELLGRIRRDFQNVLLSYNLRGMDLEIHLHQRPGREIPTIAWTAGGKVSLLFERDDVNMDSGLFMSRDVSREFLIFLMYHELGHNFWPPEHIVPIYAAGRMWVREGRGSIPVADIVSQVVDIIVNKHILDWDVSRFFPDVTSRQIYKSNLEWDNKHSSDKFNMDDIQQIKRRWDGMHPFRKWQFYYYHYPNLPVPNETVLPLLNKMISKKPSDTISSWRDEFYPLWLDLIEKYHKNQYRG